MELSKLKDKSTLYCTVRRRHVAASPEETVRQRLLEQMTKQLGFPIGCIAVEKTLQQMPHLTLCGHALPSRRADIVCFAKGINPHFDLYPLMLVECKAIPLMPAVIRQVIGYNYYLKAYYIVIANQHEIKIGCIDPKNQGYKFTNGLPHYQELLKPLSP